MKLIIFILIVVCCVRWIHIEKTYDYMRGVQNIHVPFVDRFSDFIGLEENCTAPYNVFGFKFRWFCGLSIFGVPEDDSYRKELERT